jgi:chromosome segregation ATPase
MNYFANQLRSQLNKQRLAYESGLTLLKEINPEAQKYLDLEEKVKETERNLTIANEKLTELKTEAELKEKDKERSHQKQLSEKEIQINKLEKKITADEEMIFNLSKEIRENQAYFQRELRKVKEDYQEKLQAQTKQLRAEITLLNSSGTDQQRELAERAKLIAKLEEQAKESQKELDFANSKTKQLNPLFNQVLTVIKKNVILRLGAPKKELKEAITQIQELME